MAGRRDSAVPRRTRRRHAGGGSRSAMSAPRLALLVLRLAEAGQTGMNATELLEVSALRELYSAGDNAAYQALSRDLRALGGGPLRSLAHEPHRQEVPVLSGGQMEPLIARDPVTGRYRLRAGVATVRLADAALEALCVLALALAFGEGRTVPGASQLLNQLGEALPTEQRAALAAARSGQAMDHTLPRLDLGLATADAIDDATLRNLRLAQRRHQTIAFGYHPAHNAAGTPTRHQHDEVIEIVIGDHANLTIWCDAAQRFLDLRINRIVPESLELEPRVVSERPRRGIKIAYWASPLLVRGEITERLEDQTVERQEDGGAIVRGIARDLFRARRLLLGYGANARALEPAALVEEMEREVRRMAEQYGLRGEADSGKGDP